MTSVLHDTVGLFTVSLWCFWNIFLKCWEQNPGPRTWEAHSLTGELYPWPLDFDTPRSQKCLLSALTMDK